MAISADSLLIGDVAQASGKAASAIRYYERIGLIPAPGRVSGRRRYPRSALRALAIIDTAQRAGLTLDEIRPLLAAAPADLAVSERLRLVATRKLPELRALIERAELVGRWLEAAAGCACPSLDDCRLFDEPDRLPAACGEHLV
jgi:MerR family transcriptional regulator, redox-sensitive transcriptional activator SoxR